MIIFFRGYIVLPGFLKQNLAFVLHNYPYILKRRILGPNGHLSNDTSAKTITELAQKHSLKHAMLGHLSKENNFPELALKTVTSELESKNITNKDIHIDVASRDYPSKLIKL